MFSDKLLLWVNDKSNFRSDFRPTSARALELLSQLVNPGTKSLSSLINSSSGLVTPGGFRSSKFVLGLRHDGTKSQTPKKESCERVMSHAVWEQKLKFAMGEGQPYCHIHSYEVPLVPELRGGASDGSMIKTRKIDLLASSTRGHPIVIEAKRSLKNATKGASAEATALLFGMFMQGLSYAVTLRYTWDQPSSGLLGEWKKTLAELGLADLSILGKLGPLGMNEVPVILAADTNYWERNFKWRARDRNYWNDFAVLAGIAHDCGYPIYAGRFLNCAEPQGAEWKLEVCSWLNLPMPGKDNCIRFPVHPNSPHLAEFPI